MSVFTEDKFTIKMIPGKMAVLIHANVLMLVKESTHVLIGAQHILDSRHHVFWLKIQQRPAARNQYVIQHLQYLITPT